LKVHIVRKVRKSVIGAKNRTNITTTEADTPVGRVETDIILRVLSIRKSIDAKASGKTSISQIKISESIEVDTEIPISTIILDPEVAVSISWSSIIPGTTRFWTTRKNYRIEDPVRVGLVDLDEYLSPTAHQLGFETSGTARIETRA